MGTKISLLLKLSLQCRVTLELAALAIDDRLPVHVIVTATFRSLQFPSDALSISSRHIKNRNPLEILVYRRLWKLENSQAVHEIHLFEVATSFIFAPVKQSLSAPLPGLVLRLEHSIILASISRS